jgi:hypothetical protein
MLSSAWESEQRQHNMIDWSNSKNNWMQPAVRKDISQFKINKSKQNLRRQLKNTALKKCIGLVANP